MTFYIKILGFALLFVAALCVTQGYRNYVKLRISEMESFIALLLHIKGRINRYLTPIPEIIKDFCDDNLLRIGFTDAVASGESIDSAFKNAEGGLVLGKEFKKILGEAFGTLGRGYREEVLINVDEVTSDLEKILNEEKETLPKDIKVFSAVLCAGVLGIFILLV